MDAPHLRILALPLALVGTPGAAGTGFVDGPGVPVGEPPREMWVHHAWPGPDEVPDDLFVWFSFLVPKQRSADGLARHAIDHS